MPVCQEMPKCRRASRGSTAEPRDRYHDMALGPYARFGKDGYAIWWGCLACRQLLAVVSDRSTQGGRVPRRQTKGPGRQRAASGRAVTRHAHCRTAALSILQPSNFLAAQMSVWTPKKKKTSGENRRFPSAASPPRDIQSPDTPAARPTPWQQQAVGVGFVVVGSGAAKGERLGPRPGQRVRRQAAALVTACAGSHGRCVVYMCRMNVRLCDTTAFSLQGRCARSSGCLPGWGQFGRERAGLAGWFY